MGGEGGGEEGRDETGLECQGHTLSSLLPQTPAPTPTPQSGTEEDSALTQVGEEVLCHLKKSLGRRK